jgi:branched-chain amino acid transport system permease protein
MWAAWRVVHSPFGRVLVSIRDNTQRARALGYEVERYKLLAFVLSAGLTGLAGGVFAINHGFVALTELHWSTSGEVVLMTVLGGIGTLWGGILGAFLTVELSDYLTSSGFGGIDLITGLVFVIVVLLFRRGIWGTVRHQWLARRLRRMSSRRSSASADPAGR